MTDDYDMLFSNETLKARVDELERKLNALLLRDLKVSSLDNISETLGIMRAGAFIAGDGDPFQPDGAFTGVGMSADAVLDALGNGYNVFGMSAGKFQFGLDAATGRAMFDGGDSVIDENGIRFTSGGDNLQFDASQTIANDISGFIGHSYEGFRLLLATGISATELVTNGNFATGDLTGWSSSGAVAVTRPTDKTGYAARLQTDSAYIVSNTTFAVTAGSRYLVRAGLKLDGTDPSVSPPSLNIRWYTAGSVLISTTTIPPESTYKATWIRLTDLVTAPATATKATIYIPTTTVHVWATDISVRLVSTGAKLWLSGALDKTVNIDGDFRAGGVVYGVGMDAGSGRVTNVATPTTSTDGANKDYVDTTKINVGYTSQTIADDGVFSFTPTRPYGILLVAAEPTAYKTNYAICSFRVPATSHIQTITVSANVATTTGALTGTTGTDGKLTLSANSANGMLYIENRLGASIAFTIKAL